MCAAPKSKTDFTVGAMKCIISYGIVKYPTIHELRIVSKETNKDHSNILT